MWIGVGGLGMRDGKWCSTLAVKRFMTEAKSQLHIRFASQSRSSGPFFTTGPSTMDFGALWESGELWFSDMLFATPLLCYRTRFAPSGVRRVMYRNR